MKKNEERIFPKGKIIQINNWYDLEYECIEFREYEGIENCLLSFRLYKPPASCRLSFPLKETNRKGFIQINKEQYYFNALSEEAILLRKR